MYRPYYLSPGVDHLSITLHGTEDREIVVVTIRIMGDVGYGLEL